MTITNKVKQAQTQTIKRSEIILAHYNPRKISDDARKKLKANLKRIGILGGVVWNENSGNLVSGHQKVSIMDELNKYNSVTLSNDYLLRVEVVHLTAKEEKEQNIFMNSKSAQGEFDVEMMKELLVDIDYRCAGLDDIDLAMFDISIPELDTSINQPAWGLDTEENKIARKVNVALNKQRVISERNDNDRGAESYICITFNNKKAKEAFLLKFGYDPTLQFIKGEEFNEMAERTDY